MSDEAKKLLTDILQSIALVEQYTSGKLEFERYAKDRQLKDAVERRLEIIGEATKALLDLDSSIAISSARKIVNTRNKLIHGYDEVEDVIVWEIVVKHLPVLKSEVKILLKQS
jgi:uncharacterized protein with HEPN domain